VRLKGKEVGAESAKRVDFKGGVSREEERFEKEVPAVFPGTWGHTIFHGHEIKGRDTKRGNLKEKDEGNGTMREALWI